MNATLPIMKQLPMAALGITVTWHAVARAQPATPDVIGLSGGPSALAPLPPTEPSDAHLHDGFYFRFALGPAFVSATGVGSSSSVGARGAGIGEMIAFGGTPASGLVIGGTATFNTASATVDDGGQTVSGIGSLGLGMYGVMADWFPDPRAGWHLGGSVGLALTSYGVSALGFSAGASVFGGYDFWVAPQWSLGALLVASSAFPTRAEDRNGGSGTYDLVPATLAFEATVLCH